MEAMALKQVQKEKTTVMTSRMITKIATFVTEYGKNEDLAVTIAMICTLVILAGVAMMNIAVMVMAALVLIVAFIPTVLRWVKEDYNREI